MQPQASPRQATLRRWRSMENERSTWLPAWRKLSEYLSPETGRFLTQDRNHAGKVTFGSIKDNTGQRALRILAAGMMAGMTSPARPWFRLVTPDSALNERKPVKRWLDDVAVLMREVFARSNTYRALHSMYHELGVFGTASSLILADYRDVLRHYPATAGEYCLALDARQEIATFYRQFDMTVEQMLGEFGREAVSQTVRNLADAGNLDAWVTVVHAVEPRKVRDASRRDSVNMPYASRYIELGAADDKVLRESGFKSFPCVAPRWHALGGDIYGTGPGWMALGDVKQLQHEQIRKAEGIDYLTKPPLQLPAALRNAESNLLPGGLTYVDVASSQSGIRSAFDTRIDLSHLLTDIQDVRARVDRVFYADLFLMLANDTRSGITATEVAERHEEKLLMLGPVMERLHNEMLMPLIEAAFSRMAEAKILPPPPQEMVGMDLTIEFVSTMAQAQRAIGLAAVDRLLGTVSSLAQIKPEALDKIDADAVVDGYADAMGVDPDYIVGSEQVALIRKQRAEKAAAAEQAAMMQQTAQTLQTASQADTSGQNALTGVMDMFSGYS